MRLSSGRAYTEAVSVADNLQRVREALYAACLRAGRTPETVQLMAVSKTHPAELIEQAYAAGQRIFGENRVQEWAAKAPRLTACTDLQLHLIGPLQNNKTARAAELFSAIDTVDSAKTAIRLNTTAAQLNRVLPVIVEVKLSSEPSKHGVPPDQLESLLEAMTPLHNLRISGLMTVPPGDAPGDAARPFFQRLRALRDQHARQVPSLVELSMGMSSDFETAIEEGATTIRLGTAIFGKRE